MLTEINVCEYARKLASEEAAPGGGSAAALSGLLGASLLEMVIALTLGKEEFRVYEDTLARKRDRLVQLHSLLEELVDRDALAFSDVIQAFQMPKETPEEQAARKEAIQKGYRKAAEVPLETARACLEVLEIGRVLLGKVNHHAVSDLAVGAMAAHTGVAGALFNTAINLPAITDPGYVKALKGQVYLLKKAADELVTIIQKSVCQADCFAELR